MSDLASRATCSRPHGAAPSAKRLRSARCSCERWTSTRRVLGRNTGRRSSARDAVTRVVAFIGAASLIVAQRTLWRAHAW